MKRKNLVIIGAAVIIIVVCFYFRSMIGAVIIHSEKIGKSELTAMLKTKLYPPKTKIVTINGKEYLIPLPENSAEYCSEMYPKPRNGKQYLTSTTDLDNYLKVTLPKYGWEWKDQLGALIIIKRSDTSDTFGIDMTHFTHFYLKLAYEDVGESKSADKIEGRN